MIEKIVEWKDDEKKIESDEKNKILPVVLVEELEIATVFPVCRKCYCRSYVERLYSDGTSKMICWSCKAEVDGQPKPDIDKVNPRLVDV